MIKVYLGFNTGIGAQKIRVITGNSNKPLKHIVLHSPEGFQWGYLGSGPADTALSILADYLGFAPSDQIYQTFKMDLIATAGKKLEIDGETIRFWIQAKFPELQNARKTN